MTGKPAEAPGLSMDGRPIRGLAAPRPDQAALSSGIVQLRDALLRRLEQVENLALKQTSLLQQSASEREQELSDRVASLEAAQARLLAEARRREQEWQAQSVQLESDRLLLAESWERLEQERLESHHHDPAPLRPAAAPERPVAAQDASKAYRPSGADESEDPVTRAILRQFQSLKSDVRKNSKGRAGR